MEKTSKVKTFEIMNLYLDTDENIARTETCLKALRDGVLEGCTYAFIRHDNDFYEEDTFSKQDFHLLGRAGEKKKVHYHCYCKMNKPTLVSTICTHLGIDNTQVQSFKEQHFTNKLLYLTHVAHPEKTQYPYTSVESSIPEYIEHINMNYVPKIDITLELLKYFELQDLNGEYLNKYRYVKIADFLVYCEENNMLTKFKEDYRIVADMIREHNALLPKDQEVAQILALEKARQEAKDHNVKDQLRRIIASFGCVSYVEDNLKFVVTENKGEKKHGKLN